VGTNRRILVNPDPRLRAPNRAVHLPDRGLRRLIDDMVVTMRKAEVSASPRRRSVSPFGWPWSRSRAS
jgi:peptide deformylase